MKCINWTLSDRVTQRVWLVENLNFNIFFCFFSHYLKWLLQLFEVLTSKLDHCNSLLCNVPKNVIKKLQSVQNAAARLITRFRKCDHITPVLFDLHWLPVCERIKFKILLLTFKALHQQSPTHYTYLLDRFGYLLRLSLSPVSGNFKTYGSRAFSVSADELWNKLPDDIRSCKNLSLFKHKLKTYLLKNFYI